MLYFLNYLKFLRFLANTTIIPESSDKSRKIAKIFYLLHFRHTLLPFYIVLSAKGRKEQRKSAASIPWEQKLRFDIVGFGFFLLLSQLPESNSTGGGDIQGIDAVGHGDLDGVIAGGDG